MTPILSIIIPVYNKEKYIRHSLESILLGKDLDFEVIVVNDGSTDSSLSIIKSFLSDKRVSLFSIDNHGVSYARNLGLQQAKGKYILFIDSDDFISKSYLRKWTIIIKNNPRIDLFIGGLTKCTENHEITEVITPCKIGEVPDSIFYNTFMREQGLKGIYGFVANKVVKREFLLKNRIKFNDRLKLAEDFDFFLDVYSNKPKIYFVDINDYFYIQGTLNSSVFIKQVDYMSLIGIWIKTYLFLKREDGISNNKEVLYEKVSGLSKALFNELDTLSYSSISKNIKDLHCQYSILDDYNFDLDVISQCIKRRLVIILMLYLKIRRIFHKIKVLQNGK